MARPPLVTSARRRPRRLWTGAACIVAVLLGAVPAGAAWHRLDSPNFVVVGDASGRQLRDVAVKFEAFREILARLRGKEMATAAVPTVILVFRSDKAFTPYAPRFQGRPKKLDGLFVGGPDVNYIAFVNDNGDQAPRIMYHEYAHLVVNNLAGSLPLWLNEGLAELYSTFELARDGREVLIGRPISEHLALLDAQPLLKLPELLQVDHSSPLYNEGERRSVFYAQAWALVHMISFGEPSRTKQLGVYMQRLSEGAPPADAWAQAFGSDRIDRELDKYVGQRIYRAVQHKYPEKLARVEAAAKPLAASEVHGFLADFLLRQRRVDEAAEQLAAGLKVDEHNTALRVLAAHVDNIRDDHAAAIQRVLSIGDTDDWLAAYYAGVALSEAVRHKQDRRADVIAAAGRLFDAAARQREFPNALVRRAEMDIAEGNVPAQDSIAAVHRARTAAPGREDYAFVHAQLLALRSEFAAARSVMGPLLSSAHDRGVRDAARSLMGWIVTLEKHRADAAAMAAARETRRSETPAPTEAAADASVERVQAAFRQAKPDERRIDAILQRIECPARGPAVFVLKTTDELVRFAAPRMSEVEFITYREDLTGAVTCGPLKEPMRVYVTLREGAKPDAPAAVVAVEFLPKDMQ